MSMSDSTLNQGAARSWQNPKVQLFAGIALMYAYVMVTTESFLFDRSHPQWAHIAPFQHILLPHGIVAALALFLAPFQFSERLRRKYFTLHKTFGYLYITGCFIGAPLGVYIQWIQQQLGERPSFTMAAAVNAVIWIFATAMALYFVRQRKVQQHRIWMTRSFAVALV